MFSLIYRFTYHVFPVQYPGIPNYWVLSFGFCIFSLKIYTDSSSHNVFIYFLGYINHCNVLIWWISYLDPPWACFCCLVYDHLIFFCRMPGNVLLTLWWKIIEDRNGVIFLHIGFNILWQAVRKTWITLIYQWLIWHEVEFRAIKKFR